MQYEANFILEVPQASYTFTLKNEKAEANYILDVPQASYTFHLDYEV